MKHVVVRPSENLTDYAERVAAYFEGTDIFYREDGEEAVILAHVSDGPTTVVSVRLGNYPQIAEIPPYHWKQWTEVTTDVICDPICAESGCTACSTIH